MDELTRNFGTNLREVRLSRMLTQNALARLTELSVSYVSMLERGQRSPPLGTVARVAQALQVRPIRLLQELRAPEARSRPAVRTARSA